MIITAGVVAIVVLLIYVFLKNKKLFLKEPTALCQNTTSLKGKTVIVTGANEGKYSTIYAKSKVDGIGFETALEFAKRGARVILACRNEEKAAKTHLRITTEAKNTNVLVKLVDLGSFESVRKFAKEINETEKQLDILVNNAGVGASQKLIVTADGHNEVLQVNYLSSFLMTHLLLDLLKKSNDGRILNVSSMMALFASTNLTLNSSSYNVFNYSKSKLFNILFTKVLSQELKSTTVTVYSLHPGVFRSQIYDNASIINRIIVLIFFKKFMITCKEAAQTTIYCATEQNLQKYNGRHFHNCHRVADYWNAKDNDKANKLYKETKVLVGLV